MPDCVNVLIINQVIAGITSAIAASSFAGIPVYKNRITPIPDSKFISVYRAGSDNIFISTMYTDTCYSIMFEIKCKGTTDDEAENILATALNGVLNGSMAGDIASSVEYAGSLVEYDTSGTTVIYLAVGSVIVKYMLNNDNHFSPI